MKYSKILILILIEIIMMWTNILYSSLLLHFLTLLPMISKKLSSLKTKWALLKIFAENAEWALLPYYPKKVYSTRKTPISLLLSKRLTLVKATSKPLEAQILCTWICSESSHSYSRPKSQILQDISLKDFCISPMFPSRLLQSNSLSSLSQLLWIILSPKDLKEIAKNPILNSVLSA